MVYWAGGWGFRSARAGWVDGKTCGRHLVCASTWFSDF